MAIYHREKCPICEKELEVNQNGIISRYSCRNECYIFQIYEVTIVKNRKKTIQDDTGTVFNRITIFHVTHDFKNLKTEGTPSYIALIEKINYWKENDRYLAKIMNGES